jgi:hypothetical protein
MRAALVWSRWPAYLSPQKGSAARLATFQRGAPAICGIILNVDDKICCEQGEPAGCANTPDDVPEDGSFA